MPDDPIFCSDIRPGSTPNTSAGCCDSCHDDEERFGFNDMWREAWLHVCCWQIAFLERLGVDRADEAAVRRYVANVKEIHGG